MDKNIAAILRKDARTVSVSFNGADRTYTYITNLDFEVDDYAVVEVGGALKVVQIVSVAPDLRIAPGSDIQFKWIVAKVDFTEYEKNVRRNAHIEDQAAKFGDVETARANLASLLE